MTTPSWLQDALFYQIFPDRFAKSNPDYNPPNLQLWGAPPTLNGIQGGDLRGILQHLDYLLDMGFNAIYLNPIFLSPSNHRYNTSDYFTIDPRLGKLKDFHDLVSAAHANGIHIVLDGVFNHCSRGFFAFTDLLENGPASTYLDWFHIKKFPLNAFTSGKARNYVGWWGYKSLPKFNTDTPAVRRYILEAAGYWIEQGADGWRLDVPNEIDDDAFWAEFRGVVKTANPQACLIGEIWNIAPRWVSEGHFDGLMNYPLRAAILGWLMKPGTSHSGVPIPHLTFTDFTRQLEELVNLYPRENVFSMYNLLGSHDTERLPNLLDNDLERVKLAYTILYAYPGAVSMYYGDEIGLTGGRDPDCRGAFPWQPENWNHDLRAYIHKMIDLRKRLPALRLGDYQRVLLDAEHNCYAFARSLDTDRIIVAFNADPEAHELTLPSKNPLQPLQDLLGGVELQLSDSAIHLRLPAWGIAWIG
jgi:cyclomaltodextrinase